jgi:hypothetical protein
MMMTMIIKKNHIKNLIHKRCKKTLSRVVINDCITAITQLMAEKLSNKEAIIISNFGIFSIKFNISKSLPPPLPTFTAPLEEVPAPNYKLYFRPHHEFAKLIRQLPTIDDPSKKKPAKR